MRALFKHIYNLRLITFLYDVMLIPFAWYGAYWLRFNLEFIPPWAIEQLQSYFPYIICSQIITYKIFGTYRGVWKFSSIFDLVKVISSILLAGGLFVLVLFFINRLTNFPRSIIPNYFFLLTILMCGSRFFLRLFYDTHKLKSCKLKRTLLIGAGKAGEIFVRDVLKSSVKEFKPVAFIDDDYHKFGTEIRGIRVAGTTKDIQDVVKKYKVEHIIITMPSIEKSKLKDIIDMCLLTNLQISLIAQDNDSNFIKHNVYSRLRPIDLDDLLGREVVKIDDNLLSSTLCGKCILVSGAGGSIGSELCSQILRYKPSLLIAVDNSEYNLFNLEQELKNNIVFDNCNICYKLSDIKDELALTKIFKQHKPQIVFHAAAYKHVPLLQDQAIEASKNNILATKNLVLISMKENVDKFIMVSTDKAVNPTNIMGLTKRIAEMICQYYNTYNKTKFITVRFGNVLGSAGSIVPTFKKQLEKGGPLTVTHPDITRYFMTIYEASQLILQALTLGDGGELYVLDMGESIKIIDLAKMMIRLYGKIVDVDIKIKFTGLRPGEKLFEELSYENENLKPTTFEKILRANAPINRLEEFKLLLNKIESATTNYDEVKLYGILNTLLKEGVDIFLNKMQREEISKKANLLDEESLIFV